MNGIGVRLRTARKVLGLTLETFGERIGVKKSTLSAIENEKSNLTELLAKAICKEYNINYFWLTKGEGEMFFTGQNAIIDELSDEYNLSKTGTAIITAFLNLSPSARDGVEQYILNICDTLNNKEQS